NRNRKASIHFQLRRCELTLCIPRSLDFSFPRSRVVMHTEINSCAEAITKSSSLNNLICYFSGFTKQLGILRITLCVTTQERGSEINNLVLLVLSGNLVYPGSTLCITTRERGNENKVIEF